MNKERVGKSDDLAVLQQEAEELNKRNQQKANSDCKEDETESVEETTNISFSERSSDHDSGEDQKSDDNLVTQLEDYFKEIEVPALEKEHLVLLTTLAVGVLIGHLITRK